MVFLALLLSFSPWGTDAILVDPTPPPTEISQCATPLFGPLSEALIAFHQNIVSPADGPRSHFIPSSSNYTLDAIRKYGFFKGYVMGCDRLMRENNDPWLYRTVRAPDDTTMKWDPVR